MLLLQQKGREKAYDRVLRAIEQDSLREALLDDGTGWNLQVDALNESAAADFFCGGVVLNQNFKFVLQVAAYLGDIPQQVLFFDDCQIFQRHTTGQRSASEGRAMLSGGDGGGELFARQERAQGQSGGDRLGDGDDVRLHAERLEGEQISGATQTTLDLVEDERDLMLIR